MAEGYIKIYRTLTENKIWKDKPFSKGQAWVDLLMRANHKDNKILIGNNWVEVKRGEFITSVLQLSKDWGWSRHKVCNFLICLENDHMLGHQKDTTHTHVKISQYCFWQDTENDTGMKKDNKRTTTGQRRDTNNNVKNDKEEYNNPQAEAKASVVPEISLYAKCINLYNDFVLKETGYGAKIDGTQGKALNDILSYLKKQVSTKNKGLSAKDIETKVYESLEIVFKNWAVQTEWQRSRVKLTDINGQFTNILAAIRKSKTGQTTIDAKATKEIFG